MSGKRKTRSREETTARAGKEREPAERSDEELDEQLDHELEDTFPASDPPSLTQDQR